MYYEIREQEQLRIWINENAERIAALFPLWGETHTWGSGEGEHFPSAKDVEKTLLEMLRKMKGSTIECGRLSIRYSDDIYSIHFELV